MAPIYLNRILKPASSIHSYNQKEIQNTTFWDELKNVVYF